MDDQLKRIHPVAIFVPLIIVLVVEFFHSSYNYTQKQQEYELGHRIASGYAQKIQKSVTSATNAVLMIEAFHMYADLDTSRFYEWAPKIPELVPDVSVVQLAPNGIVTLIEPMEGNEGALGHDLLKDERRDDGALLALNNRETVFVGPLRLIQNDKLAVIARKPLFATNEESSFWGFAIVVIHLEDIISLIIEHVNHPDYAVTIFGNDPDVGNPPLIYSTNPKTQNMCDIRLPITLPFGEWYIQLVHNSDQSFGKRNFTHILLISLGLLLIVALNQFLIYRNRILFEKEKALREMNRLKEFLPICSVCKKIRDDDGYWQQIESYISEHSETEFSHSICPDCQKNLYPDLFDNYD